VMEGHLRGIVGLLTVEQIVKEPEMVAGRVRETVADDLSKMGLEVVSFTIKKVMDEKDYISNMGRPDVARIRREADIAQAEAERDTAIRRAMASRESAVALAQADQERVIAQTASETRQAEATRDLEVKRAEYDVAVRRQRATAEKAYDIASNEAQQLVIAAQVGIEQVQRQEQIKVQELEVRRRERELEATVLNLARAEQQRIETMADAESQRLSREATGHAEAIRLQGLAEADIIRARGQAEADAMRLKAAAFREYNQAAVLDKLLTGMPEVARAFATALGGVDKITVVSTGDSRSSAGASAITGEVAKMVAQMPELFETLTGMKISQMLGQLKQVDNNPVVEATPVAVAPNGTTRQLVERPATPSGPSGDGPGAGQPGDPT
jgi:flotillin